jgi:hypothetical protein
LGNVHRLRDGTVVVRNRVHLNTIDHGNQRFGNGLDAMVHLCQRPDVEIAAVVRQ